MRALICFHLAGYGEGCPGGHPGYASQRYHNIGNKERLVPRLACFF